MSLPHGQRAKAIAQVDLLAPPQIFEEKEHLLTVVAGSFVVFVLAQDVNEAGGKQEVDGLIVLIQNRSVQRSVPAVVLLSVKVEDLLTLYVGC